MEEINRNDVTQIPSKWVQDAFWDLRQDIYTPYSGWLADDSIPMESQITPEVQRAIDEIQKTAQDCPRRLVAQQGVIKWRNAYLDMWLSLKGYHEIERRMKYLLKAYVGGKHKPVIVSLDPFLLIIVYKLKMGGKTRTRHLVLTPGEILAYEKLARGLIEMRREVIEDKTIRPVKFDPKNRDTDQKEYVNPLLKGNPDKIIVRK